jgi:uncharacterized protein
VADDERVVRVIDTWVIPNPPEIARRWPPHLAHVFHFYGRSEALQGQPIAQVVAEMDEAGIERAILTGLMEPGFTISNEVVAEWLRAFPDRFAARAIAHPGNPAEATHEFERWVRDHGFCALQVLPYAAGRPFSHRTYYPLFAKCVELGVPVVTQVGHTGSLLPSDPGRPLYLDDVALDFPDLVIVGGHIGWPWTEEMIALAWKHPNVYIDTSAHLPHRYPAALLDFMHGAGADKVLFGTDFPWLRFDRAVAGVLRLGLAPDVQDKFLYRNAQRIYGLASSSSAR